MDFSEIKNAVEHIKKTCNCADCDGKYKDDDINVVAATKNESLFELRCSNCGLSTIISVLVGADIEKNFSNRISENDVLDIKNFLINFDGNFKKIFNKVK